MHIATRILYTEVSIQPFSVHHRRKLEEPLVQILWMYPRACRRRTDAVSTKAKVHHLNPMSSIELDDSAAWYLAVLEEVVDPYHEPIQIPGALYAVSKSKGGYEPMPVGNPVDFHSGKEHSARPQSHSIGTAASLPPSFLVCLSEFSQRRNRRLPITFSSGLPTRSLCRRHRNSLTIWQHTLTI
ncbi:hypothetical protein BOTBODRAFT_368914 [Botryobasidium botryosum FD-172 SS1]|uniref:Uncharacterized protein n=1 Tax=Botryobasidium botryosum (strain FD-172 SS1) TaxID=930990 RepID=A0A067MFK1_BOTB1|nr:hypothetical protein BOTBODRAFT_368914 [Botryobasidium botryosum FD-172 SS1]